MIAQITMPYFQAVVQNGEMSLGSSRLLYLRRLRRHSGENKAAKSPQSRVSKRRKEQRQLWDLQWFPLEYLVDAAKMHVIGKGSLERNRAHLGPEEHLFISLTVNITVCRVLIRILRRSCL